MLPLGLVGANAPEVGRRIVPDLDVEVLGRSQPSLHQDSSRLPPSARSVSLSSSVRIRISSFIVSSSSLVDCDLLVHRLELLVRRLELLVRRLELLVRRLELLVRRLQLLHCRLELLVGAPPPPCEPAPLSSCSLRYRVMSWKLTVAPRSVPSFATRGLTMMSRKRVSLSVFHSTSRAVTGRRSACTSSNSDRSSMRAVRTASSSCRGLPTIGLREAEGQPRLARSRGPGPAHVDHDLRDRGLVEARVAEVAVDRQGKAGRPSVQSSRTLLRGREPGARREHAASEVDRDEETRPRDERLRLAEKEVAVVVEREVEVADDPPLRLGVEIHERVPADEQVDSRDRRVLDDVVAAEDHTATEVLPDRVPPVVVIEVAVAQLLGNVCKRLRRIRRMSPLDAGACSSTSVA